MNYPNIRTFQDLINDLESWGECKDRELAVNEAREVFLQAVRFMANHRVTRAQAEKLVAVYEKVRYP